MIFTRKITLFFCLFLSLGVQAEISRNNTVDWVGISKVSSNRSNFIQLETNLQNPDDCKKGSSPKPRIRLAKEDTELLSLFLAAKAARLKIGFYYTTSSDLVGPSGHGVAACEFVNVWIESNSN